MRLHWIEMVSSVLCLIALASHPLEAAELRIERVFGPEVPTGPYKHPACLTELSNGDLYLVHYGDTWSTSRVQFKVSRDHAETWSDASVLSSDQGDMVRNRPIVLNDGDYLLPLYHETGDDPERVGPDSTSLFVRFNPAKRTWTKTAAIRSPRGNIQPAVVQLDDNHLIAYCRRGGDYDPKTVGSIVRSESHDGGRTWSEGRDS